MTRNVIDEPVVGGRSTGSSLVGDLRVGARIARRSLRKHWAANLIVVLLIALPVAGIGAMSTLVRSKLSGERYQARPGEPRKGYELDQWGAADFRLQSTGNSITAFEAGVWANLPKGSLVEPESYLLCGRLRAAPPGATTSAQRTKRVSAQLFSSDLGSPVFRGRRTLSSGTWAKRANELVVSVRLAKSLNLSPGSTVTGCAKNYTVTGVAESPDGGRYVHEAFVFPTNSNGDTFYVTLPAVATPAKPLIGLNGQPFALPGKTRIALPASQPLPPITFVTPKMLAQDSRQGMENSLWIIRALGAIALVILGALAAAVFTVSAHRQRQSAGLLSLTGATTRAVHCTLLLQGTWCGVLATVLGGAIGLAGLQLIVPFRDDIFSAVLGSYAWAPGDWLWAMVIAVVASTLAALRPARSVAEGNLLRSGRDRSTLPRLISAGGRFVLAVSAAAGFGILTSGSNGNRVNLAPQSWALPFALLAVAASVAAVWIGSPLLLRGLTSFTSRFPSLRLSARALTRNLNRSAATMSGVGVVFGVLVAILLATSNATAYSSANYASRSGVSLHRNNTIPCSILNEPTPPLPTLVLEQPALTAVPTPPNPAGSSSSVLTIPLATIPLRTNPLAPSVPSNTVPALPRTAHPTIAVSSAAVVQVLPKSVIPLTTLPSPSNAPAPPTSPVQVVPQLQHSVTPWELCLAEGLSDDEIRKAQGIIGRPGVEIQRYQVNNNQAPSVTVANPELIRLLGLSVEEQSILEREGIIDYWRNGADISVYRGADGQLHNIGSLATPGLADLVREEVIRSASFTQVKTRRMLPYPIVYLVTEKALLDPAKLAEKSILVATSYVSLDKPLTGAQRDSLQDVLDDRNGQLSLSNRGAIWSPLISLPPPDNTNVMARVRLIASGIAGAIALLSIALSLALSAVETRNDHRRLAAIGASPKTIRRLRTQSSALLAFGGCVIAVIVALPVFRMVLWAGDDRSDHVRHPIPFTSLAITIAAVTTAAALLGLLFRPRK
jgi:hypothetical protein